MINSSNSDSSTRVRSRLDLGTGSTKEDVLISEELVLIKIFKNDIPVQTNHALMLNPLRFDSKGLPSNNFK